MKGMCLKSFRSRLIAVACGTAISFSLSATCAIPAYAATYIDVPANHWALTSGILDEAVELGILKGSTVDGAIYLRPDEQVTRAEVATMLMRLSGASADAWGSTNTSGWSDVPSGAWYTPALNWASAKGILNGSNGLVRPDDPVTRQELACMLSNYEMRLGSGSIEAAVDALAAFPDAGSVASWAQESVAWAAENGIVTGNADGTFAPERRVTRAELAILLWRQAELLGSAPASTGDLSAYVDGESVATFARQAMAWALEAGLYDALITDTIYPNLPVSREQFAQVCVAFLAAVEGEPLAVELAAMDSRTPVVSASRANHNAIQAAVDAAEAEKAKEPAPAKAWRDGARIAAAVLRRFRTEHETNNMAPDVDEKINDVAEDERAGDEHGKILRLENVG